MWKWFETTQPVIYEAMWLVVLTIGFAMLVTLYAALLLEAIGWITFIIGVLIN